MWTGVATGETAESLQAADAETAADGLKGVAVYLEVGEFHGVTTSSLYPGMSLLNQPQIPILVTEVSLAMACYT